MLHHFRNRRGIIGVIMVIGLVWFALARPWAVPHPDVAGAAGADTTSNQEQPMVRVRVFDKQGKLTGPIDSAKVVKTEEEWKKILTPDQYRITRDKDTERAFCGTLLDNHKKGVYTCVDCGLPLFSSDAKFNSGTGWPSFFQPIAPENVAEHSDTAYGMTRTEILCARCGAHLGHVFEDGPRPTGLRFCLNSESLKFTDSDKLATLADPAAESGATTQPATQPSASSSTTATAVFAGGCFWCSQAAFEPLKGIVNIEVGYAGGSKETANYERVSEGDTGHAEAIRITYDPKKITYDQLLDVFFDAHDPTQLNGQGADMGTQYRSAIFYADAGQKQAAENKIKHLTAKKAFSKPIVTTLEPLKAFYLGEKYHQDYAKLHPEQPYIQYEALPKAEKVREKHPDLVKDQGENHP